MKRKWQIMRAGVNGLGYSPGWFAIDPHTERSTWKPTWGEAVEYALEQIASYGLGAS
jgi:hypothetical protein